MRPGKRERRALREMDKLRFEQIARANAVPSLPGRARGSLDDALKGNTISASKPKWDYLLKRVNGVARLSLVRKPDDGLGEQVIGPIPLARTPKPSYLDKKKRKKRFANA